MPGCASPLFPPPGPPGALALVAGEANFVFGNSPHQRTFLGRTGLWGQCDPCSRATGKKHQELRTDRAPGVYIPRSGVPQNQEQQNSEVAKKISAFAFVPWSPVLVLPGYTIYFELCEFAHKRLTKIQDHIIVDPGEIFCLSSAVLLDNWKDEWE